MTSSKGYTMYYHQAMGAPDKPKFQEAMLKEFQDHCNRSHFKPVQLTDIPSDTKLLDLVWLMKRKGDIITQSVTIFKARLNIHGGQKEHGAHNW